MKLRLCLLLTVLVLMFRASAYAQDAEPRQCSDGTWVMPSDPCPDPEQRKVNCPGSAGCPGGEAPCAGGQTGYACMSGAEANVAVKKEIPGWMKGRELAVVLTAAFNVQRDIMRRMMAYDDPCEPAGCNTPCEGEQGNCIPYHPMTCPADCGCPGNV